MVPAGLQHLRPGRGRGRSGHLAAQLGMHPRVRAPVRAATRATNWFTSRRSAAAARHAETSASWRPAAPPLVSAAACTRRRRSESRVASSAAVCSGVSRPGQPEEVLVLVVDRAPQRAAPTSGRRSCDRPAGVQHVGELRLRVQHLDRAVAARLRRFQRQVAARPGRPRPAAAAPSRSCGRSPVRRPAPAAAGRPAGTRSPIPARRGRGPPGRRPGRRTAACGRPSSRPGRRPVGCRRPRRSSGRRPRSARRDVRNFSIRLDAAGSSDRISTGRCPGDLPHDRGVGAGVVLVAGQHDARRRPACRIRAGG